MKTLFSLCLMSLFSVSCIKNKAQHEIVPYSLAHEGVEKINSECALIRETGDIFELLKMIRTDTRKVLKLVEGNHYPGIENRVEDIASEINQNVERVIELSKSEWNSPDVRHNIRWLLDDSDFGSKNLFVFGAKVKQVYFLGKERPDLIPRVMISQTGNDFIINYLNASTLLEFCQLNETLIVTIEIKYKALLRTKSKFFNLHVNLEK